MKLRLWNFLIVTFALSLSVAGCGTIGAATLPGQTTASLQLKADILRMIDMIEKANGCSYHVLDTKVIGIENGAVKEEWIVESCGKKIIYPVELTPDPSGGTYFRVSTPNR